MLQALLKLILGDRVGGIILSTPKEEASRMALARQELRPGVYYCGLLTGAN